MRSGTRDVVSDKEMFDQLQLFQIMDTGWSGDVHTYPGKISTILRNGAIKVEHYSKPDEYFIPGEYKIVTKSLTKDE